LNQIYEHTQLDMHHNRVRTYVETSAAPRPLF
jgi:hypothetical protein